MNYDHLSNQTLLDSLDMRLGKRKNCTGTDSANEESIRLIKQELRRRGYRLQPDPWPKGEE